MILENINGAINNLQVSKLFLAELGIEYHSPVLIKNNTEDEVISANVLLYNSSTPITTLFYPGWNPELIKKIISCDSIDSLLIGI